MRKVATNPVFNVTNKTITLSEFSSSNPLKLINLHSITDMTTGQTLFAFANTGYSTATVSNNVITLSKLPSGVANGDVLSVVYEAGASSGSSSASLTTISEGQGVAAGIPSMGKVRLTVATFADGDLRVATLDAQGNQGVYLATALTESVDHVLTYPRGTNYASAIAANALVMTGSGKLMGIFVSAASATPTIKLWDNTAGSGTVLVDTFTPVAGQYYAFPARRVTTGIYITISGTVLCSVDYDPTTY